MDTLNKDDFKYQQAKKRVVEVKGFYIHLLIYLLVNIGLIITRHAIEGKSSARLIIITRGSFGESVCLLMA